MLIRLVRTYLAPYKRSLALIVLLQFVGTVAALYLPSLNADIIDRGVAVGDTRYIVRTGGVMLAISLLFLMVSSVNLIGILLGKFLARSPEVGISACVQDLAPGTSAAQGE